MLYVRDPKVSDEENALLNRFYCGNPFIAPGTLGAKGRKKNWNFGGLGGAGGLLDDGEVNELQDEAFLYNTGANGVDLGVDNEENTVVNASGSALTKSSGANLKEEPQSIDKTN